MSNETDRVIIVGAGQAGGWVAMTLRELQPDRPILIIGAESHPPYERPPLSKGVLLGEAAFESAYLKPREFYAENGIDLRLDTEVTRIHREDKQVKLSDGETLDYGALVIATGLRSRQLDVPGSDHKSVRCLRAHADLEALQQHLAVDRHVVAIGAGFIGLEVAAAAIKSGCSVTVLESAPQALGRVIAPEVSAALIKRHEERGVTFKFDVQIETISDLAGRPAVNLAGGEIIVGDVILCGIGGIPNDQLALRAGLDCDNGILVDETGQTSDPDIFAVGDVAHQNSLALNRRVRLESWQNAQNQAIAVGKLIGGAPQEYNEVPWFWTDQYDFNFQIIGVPETWDRLIWRGEPGDEKFTVIITSNGAVVGGNTMNNARDIRPLKQMIIDRTTVDPEVLADMSRSLVKLQKSQAAQ